MTASPRTRAALAKRRHPTRANAIPENTVKAKAVPNHGPREEVKMIPNIWTVRTNTHRLSFHQKPAVLIGSLRVNTARVKEIEIVISMTAPARIGLPRVDVDLRRGGAFAIDMHHDNGTVHYLSGVYEEITPPRRLVFSWAWARARTRGRRPM